MKLSLLGCGLMITVALGSVSIAQEGTPVPGDSSSVSERLAWSIQAYAPCEWSTSLASIETEIASSGASVLQTSDALSSVLRSETACDQVKDAAARLLVRLPEETVPEIVEVAAAPEDESEIELEPAPVLVPENEAFSEPLIVSEDEIVVELPAETAATEEIESAVFGETDILVPDLHEVALDNAASEDLAPEPVVIDLPQSEQVILVATPESALPEIPAENDEPYVETSEPAAITSTETLDVAFKMTPPPGNPAFAGN